jgi:hypothetical protein
VAKRWEARRRGALYNPEAGNRWVVSWWRARVGVAFSRLASSRRRAVQRARGPRRKREEQSMQRQRGAPCTWRGRGRDGPVGCVRAARHAGRLGTARFSRRRLVPGPAGRSFGEGGGGLFVVVSVSACGSPPTDSMSVHASFSKRIVPWPRSPPALFFTGGWHALHPAHGSLFACVPCLPVVMSVPYPRDDSYSADKESTELPALLPLQDLY